MIDTILNILLWAGIAIAVIAGGIAAMSALIMWAAGRQRRNPHD